MLDVEVDSCFIAEEYYANDYPEDEDSSDWGSSGMCFHIDCRTRISSLS